MERKKGREERELLGRWEAEGEESIIPNHVSTATSYPSNQSSISSNNNVYKHVKSCKICKDRIK